MKKIEIGNFAISNDLPIVLIAGPCAIESQEHCIFMAEQIKIVCQKLNIGFIFKSSFDKANRTSINSARGVGIDEGLDILKMVKDVVKVPIITDVHLPDQCNRVAEIADVLQIPAFLSRQTDLLEAAAKTGKSLNIKKGQFLSPYDMENVAKKVSTFGNDKIMLCERGACFGYNNLVSDFRSIPIMARTGYPVIFDATHSIQEPSSLGNCSGGKREFVPILARAAVSVGVAGIYMEVHNDPDKAPCDGPNMLYLRDLESVLTTLQSIDSIIKR